MRSAYLRRLADSTCFLAIVNNLPSRPSANTDMFYDVWRCSVSGDQREWTVRGAARAALVMRRLALHSWCEGLSHGRRVHMCTYAVGSNSVQSARRAGRIEMRRCLWDD